MDMRFILLALLLTGCQANQPKWTATQYADKPLDQARAECEYEAEKAAPMSDLSKSPFGQAMAQHDIVRKCLKAKGFRLAS